MLSMDRADLDRLQEALGRGRPRIPPAVDQLSGRACYEGKNLIVFEIVNDTLVFNFGESIRDIEQLGEILHQ